MSSSVEASCRNVEELTRLERVRIVFKAVLQFSNSGECECGDPVQDLRLGNVPVRAVELNQFDEGRIGLENTHTGGTVPGHQRSFRRTLPHRQVFRQRVVPVVHPLHTRRSDPLLHFQPDQVFRPQLPREGVREGTLRPPQHSPNISS